METDGKLPELPVDEFDDEEVPNDRIIVCQGPPRCVLPDDFAEIAQMRGCVWCEYHYLGLKHVIIKPGEA